MTKNKKYPILIEKGYGQGLYVTDEAVFRVTYSGDSSSFSITSIYGIDALKKVHSVHFIGPRFKWSAAEEVFIKNGANSIIQEVAESEGSEVLEVLKTLNDPYVLDSSKIEMINRTSIKKYGLAIYYDKEKNQWGIAQIDIPQEC